jgi:hypothetical protein
MLEYPTLLVVALVIVGRRYTVDDLVKLKALLPTLVLIAIIGYLFRSTVGYVFFNNHTVWQSSFIFAGLCAIVWYNAKYDEKFTTFVAVLLMSFEILAMRQTLLERERNFFGVLSIFDRGEHIFMRHGTTTHGAISKQDIVSAEGQKPKPLTYYAPEGAMALSITTRQTDLQAHGKVGTYGIVGLGAGSLACYSQPGETWRYFEIDQAVVDAARNSKYFNYMQRCADKAPVILGDARITLRQEAKASYDVLIIDAFSSDSIPVHLITTEAIGEYLSLLKPDGILAFHISNRHLDLSPILAANLTLLRKDNPSLEAVDYINIAPQNTDFVESSEVVLMSMNESSIRAIKQLPSAKVLLDTGKATAWTDDFSNILAAIILNFKRLM